MTYQEYIASPGWKAKRQERLAIDGYQCVVCKSDDNLSVHHLHYESLGKEDPLHDLVSVCNRCHRLFDTIERYNRYSNRPLATHMTNYSVRERTIDNELGNIELPAGITGEIDHAQRANRRSAEPVRQRVEESIIEERQDRRRS